jgi:hypothetical protein
MSRENRIKRGIIRLLAGYVGRSMLAKGKVSRAPRYALMQVAESQVELFAAKVAPHARQFDKIVALWPAGVARPSVPANVELHQATQKIGSRWQLVSKCSDGFIFPISLSKPIQSDHAALLLKLLFDSSGASAVGLANLQDLFELPDDRAAAAGKLLLAPHIDPDFAVIDQRYWRLADAAIDGDETEGLAFEAKQRGFALFVSDHPLATTFNRSTRTAVDLEQLAEQLIRYPFAIRTLNERTARLSNRMFSFAATNHRDNDSSAKSGNELIPAAMIDESLLEDLQNSLTKHYPQPLEINQVIGELTGVNLSEVST